MMKSKKLLAILLSVALLVGVMPLAGLVLPIAAETTDDLVAYVSTAATGSGTLGSESDPFPSLTAAIAALDAAKTDGERIVKIKDKAYSISDTDGGKLSAHDNTIRIEGAEGTEIITISATTSIGGPIMFDNIGYTYASATSYLATGGFALEFGENAVLSGTSGRIYTSASSKTVMSTSGEPYKFIFNGAQNEIYQFYFADYSTSKEIPGVNFVMNDGKIGRNIYVGANSSSSTKTTTFTASVNLEFNGGDLSDATISSDNYIKHAVFTNGAALQIIFNNNMAASGVTQSITAAAVEAVGGKLYVLNCAAGGSTLHATETAGTYTIANPAWQATATDGTNTYTSQDGVLTVGAAGEYTVTWSEAPIEEEPVEIGSTVYVDYTNGDDATTSGTQAAPFKTLTAAIEALDTLDTTDERVVVLCADYAIGTNDGGKLPDHNIPITIKGEVGTEILNLTNSYSGGPLTIDSINYTIEANKSFHANGNALTFGKDAVYNKGATENANSGRFYVTSALTIDGASNKLNRVYLFANGKEEEIPGVDFVMNDGTLAYETSIYIGATKEYTTTYSDNVNIEINGGTITGQIAIQNDGRALFSNGAAVQVIFNNGTYTADKVSFSDTTATVDNLYILECTKGVYLHAAETAGEYTVEVPEGMYAVAKKDGARVAIAGDGEKLKLTEAGIYEIGYTDNTSYSIDITSDGTTLTVYEAISGDFASLPVPEKEGCIFNGWLENGEALEGPEYTLAVGTVLTAQYVAKSEHFYMNGTQIRPEAANKKQALRFIVHLGTDSGLNVTEKGTVVIPNTALGVKELVIDGVYAYGSSDYTAATIEGVNAWKTEDSYVEYTAALTGITNYLTAYAARGYIKYTDVNGVARVAYTDKTPAASLNEVAELLLDRAPDDAAAKTITDAAESAIVEKYADTIAPLSSALFNSPNTGYTRLNADIEGDGVYTTSDKTAINFYKLDGQLSPMVTEITIDAVGENANIDPTTIMQMTDIHFTYADDVDIAENNVYTMNSWENRQGNGTYFNTLADYNDGKTMNFSNYRMQYILKSLEYAAAVGDQTVVTGDMIDFISHGNLTLMNRVIAEPYSNSLMLVGNHEPVRLVSETSKLSDPNKWSDEYYEILKKYWTNHELSYTGKMVGKEVMVIQMDNSHYYFTQDQIDQLTDDLNRARRNGYTVLIFTHIPFVPTEGVSTQELLMGSGGFVESDRHETALDTNPTLIDGRDADWASATSSLKSLTPSAHASTTEAMYDLIINSGDVVRGVFNGHKHNTIYSRLIGEDGTVIPQYTLAAGFIEGGVTMKINVEDTDSSDHIVANRVLHKDAQNVIYVDDATGITVRETTLDLGLGEGNEKTIVQISDAHLNNTEKRNENWEACLAYADQVGDYTVATGDLIDAMTLPILEYFKESTASYENLMTVVGNHDWVKTDESIPEDMADRYTMLGEYFKNDPYYSTAMLGNNVMLIQMDNSQDSGKFWDSQIEKLQGDITLARDNGYHVLLFMHVPMGTMNDPAEIKVKPLYYTEADEEGWPTYNFAYKKPGHGSEDAATQAIYEIIRTSGDVIKGVFAGHLHADFYTEIKCKTSAGGQLIPQYVSHRAAADGGHVLKITLK